TRHRLHARNHRLAAQVPLQLEHVLREGVCGRRRATHRSHRVLVAAGSAPEPEVDAAGKHALEGAELLGNRQRRVIREHDAARAKTNGRGVRGDVADQDARGRGGNRRHVVMLRVPDAQVSALLGRLGQRDARLEAFPGRLSFRDGCEVEDGERDGHAACLLCGRGRVWRHDPATLQSTAPITRSFPRGEVAGAPGAGETGNGCPTPPDREEHRMAEPTEGRVAVYIDFDNIVISRYDQKHKRKRGQQDNLRDITAESLRADPELAARLATARVELGAILDFASSFGSITVSRAYADWS